MSHMQRLFFSFLFFSFLLLLLLPLSSPFLFSFSSCSSYFLSCFFLPAPPTFFSFSFFYIISKQMDELSSLQIALIVSIPFVSSLLLPAVSSCLLPPPPHAVSCCLLDPFFPQVKEYGNKKKKKKDLKNVEKSLKNL